MSDGSIPNGGPAPSPDARGGESPAASGLLDLIVASAVLPRVTATSKRQALQMLCDAVAADAGIDARKVFEAVLLRERLPGTGVGDGVAIPHARVPGLKRPVAGFARLDPPHDFDAMDARPADLVVLLLAPEDRGADHLKALARISRFMRKAELRDKLRAARGVEGLIALFAGADPRSDAAA